MVKKQLSTNKRNQKRHITSDDEIRLPSVVRSISPIRYRQAKEKTKHSRKIEKSILIEFSNNSSRANNSSFKMSNYENEFSNNSPRVNISSFKM